MGFYEQKILPYLLDLSLSAPSVAKHRRDILAEVSGEVLEVGFGTGLNLPFYPKQIHQIATVDPNAAGDRSKTNRGIWNDDRSLYLEQRTPAHARSFL